MPLMDAQFWCLGEEMKLLGVALLLVGISAMAASTQSPYSGEELREIKSLSPVEIQNLQQGSGMGFAKAAELNQYPGPKHVLELAEQLQLTGQQIAQTNHVFNKMQEKAIDVGSQLIRHEKELDSLFSSGLVSTSKLDGKLSQIGETRAKLRGVHLHAHLEMKRILSHHQIMIYDKLRGYSNGSGSHEHHHQH